MSNSDIVTINIENGLAQIQNSLPENTFDCINFSEFYKDAEKISVCLNDELKNFGFKSFPSEDKSIIFIDDVVKDKICDFIEGTS